MMRTASSSVHRMILHSLGNFAWNFQIRPTRIVHSSPLDSGEITERNAPLHLHSSLLIEMAYMILNYLKTWDSTCAGNSTARCAVVGSYAAALAPSSPVNYHEAQLPRTKTALQSPQPGSKDEKYQLRNLASLFWCAPYLLQSCQLQVILLRYLGNGRMVG